LAAGGKGVALIGWEGAGALSLSGNGFAQLRRRSGTDSGGTAHDWSKLGSRPLSTEEWRREDNSRGAAPFPEKRRRHVNADEIGAAGPYHKVRPAFAATVRTAPSPGGSVGYRYALVAKSAGASIDFFR